MRTSTRVLIGVIVALVAGWGVHAYVLGIRLKNQRVVAAERARAEERAALVEAGWVTPEAHSNLRDTLTFEEERYGSLSQLLQIAERRYREELELRRVQDRTLESQEREILQLTSVIDSWGQGQKPTPPPSLPEADPPPGGCPCPSLWDSTLIPRATIAAVVSEGEQQALVGEHQIWWGDWDPPVMILSTPLDLSLTEWLVDEDDPCEEPEPEPDWELAGFAAYSPQSGERGAGFLASGPRWSPRVRLFRREIRPLGRVGLRPAGGLLLVPGDEWILAGLQGDW